jgi:hypothetical protein
MEKERDMFVEKLHRAIRTVDVESETGRKLRRNGPWTMYQGTARDEEQRTQN